MGRTILLTTHDLHTAKALSDRYVIISKHKIVMDGPMSETTPDEIREKYFSADVTEVNA